MSATSRQRTPPAWVTAIYKYLESRDGQAAPLRLVAEHAMGLVPPGPAWREGQAKRETDAKYRGAAPDHVSEIEKLRVIRAGSKRIVLKAIYYERQAGRLVKYQQGGRDWLRMVI